MRDKHRSGRPRKAPREFVAEKLKLNPRTLGYDVDYWTIKLLRVELAKSGVDYSLKRPYRVVKELRYRLVKPRHHRAEEDKWADFRKVRELMSSFNILFIDKSRRSISTELRRVLASKGSSNSKNLRREDV